jgi:hypothetical protein
MNYQLSFFLIFAIFGSLEGNFLDDFKIKDFPGKFQDDDLCVQQFLYILDGLNKTEAWAINR